MKTDAFHPDHLKTGHMVGPWRIVASLGSGNFGHTFKVEREGGFFTLKMAVRPAPELSQETPEKALEERQVDGRMRHEAAILMANASQPGLPHLRAVDRWPHPTKGYLYIVTDYVEGEPFHQWRERARPNAAQLVDLVIEVVRVVARLHGRGILVRDFKSEHVIVDSSDNKPMLVDLGSAWLPGGSTLTVGLAPATPHALPPECIAFIHEGAWKEGARFNANAAGDLYQLGVFFYEALTSCWPVDPRMPREELLAAIMTVIPRAPHRLNPKVPESLSRIALKLLEKRPADRYESAEALLQALWEAAKERSTKSWRVPLTLSSDGPAPVTQDEVEERRLQQQEAERWAQEAREQEREKPSREQVLEQQLAALSDAIEEQALLSEERAVRRKRRWRRIALGVGLVILLMAWVTAWRWLSPATFLAASEKGNSLVLNPLKNSRPVTAAAAWLCATLSVGCPAAQVRPLPGDCPEDAIQGMQELGIHTGAAFTEFMAVVDINQPGDRHQVGVYHEGKLVSQIVEDETIDHREIPAGTILYGQLWTEGLTRYGKDAVLGRYTDALLPDGRRLPVCLVLGDWRTGLVAKEKGSKPGEARLRRRLNVFAMEYWP